MKLIRTYFKTLSQLAPDQAGKQALKLFCTPRKLSPRAREEDFLQKARLEHVPYSRGSMPVYHYGPDDGPLLLLVHGWESRAGSMGGLAYHLSEQGYHIVAPDLEAHGKHSPMATNLFRMSEGLNAVLDHLGPKEPYSVVSHSFGSSVACYTLGQRADKIDQLILLTSPNVMIELVHIFQQQIGLTKKGASAMIRHFDRWTGHRMEFLRVADFCLKIPYEDLSIIHDKKDRVLPYYTSASLAAALPRSSMLPVQGIGHYKMLWHAEILETVGHILELSGGKKQALAGLSLP
ncbi:MAG: alpha/beta hydrolase [Bacteroidota bacterium]